MNTTSSGQSKEFARRGGEIYEQSIRQIVEKDRNGEFVAIDIDSGAWEIDADDYAATERLLVTNPKARIWLVRVGSAAAYRIGGSRTADPGA